MVLVAGLDGEGGAIDGATALDALGRVVQWDENPIPGVDPFLVLDPAELVAGVVTNDRDRRLF